MTTAAYTNAFSVDDQEVVLVNRAGGYEERPRLERAVVAWSCFVKGPLERGILRELKHAPSVKAVTIEKGYYRIAWSDRVACRAGCEYLETKGVRTYEGNVNPLRRLLVERRTLPARPRGLFVDIETDPRPGLENKTQMRILVIGLQAFDTGWKKALVLEEDTDEAERKLLTEFWKIVEEYDQIISWNGDRFDEPVIKARTKKFQIPVEPRRVLWLDHMLVFKKQNAMAATSGDEKESYALDNICKALGIPGKKSLDARQAYEYWSAGGEKRAELVDYCQTDVSRMPAIEAKTGYLELFRTLCEATGVFAHSGSIGPSHQVESFLLRLALERGYRFPTRFIDDEEDEDQYKGAVVLKASVAGIQRDVHVVDFARLYPSVIVSLNLSPETKVEKANLLEGFPPYLRNSEAYRKAEEEMKNRKPPPGVAQTPTGDWFKQEPIGMLPLAVEEMLRLRKYWDEKKAAAAPGTEEWKEADRRSSAYKIAANSFYGVLGSKGSMFFDVDVAESTTQTSVVLIQATVYYAETIHKMRSIYGDTDSAFFTGTTTERMREFVSECNERVYPKIIERMGGRNRIKLEYEKAFKRLVFSWNEKEKRPSSKKYCNPVETPIWMSDLSFKPIGEIRVGDEVFGWEKTTNGRARTSRRRLVSSKVVAVHRREAPIVKLRMESGRTIRCTPDHRWLSGGRRLGKGEFPKPKVGRLLSLVAEQPRELTTAEAIEASWLGGMYDGEGCLCGGGRSQIQIAQSVSVNPEVCERLESSFAMLGFDVHVKRARDANRYTIRGGRQERLNFVTWCKPAKAARFAKAIALARFGTNDRIVSIEPDGYGEVVGLTTTTGNYVAWGYASKNCGKYLHFKGKMATADSKPEVRGLALRRGDTLRLTREMQREVIDLLIMKECDDPFGFDALIETWKKRITEEQLAAEDVKISQGMAKGLEEYEQRPKKDPIDLGPVEVIKAEKRGFYARSFFAELLGVKRIFVKYDDLHERCSLCAVTRPGDDLRKIVGTSATLLLNDYVAGSTHVRVARILEIMGTPVRQGDRIEYIVVDGSTSPKTVVPFEDWDGVSIDRVDLWLQVWKPSKMLLKGAFPDTDWSRFDVDYPRKERAPRAPREAKKKTRKVNLGQTELALFGKG